MGKLGHYTDVEPLGCGRMGSVFSARDRRDGKRVALKTVIGGSSGYLDREFELLKTISHPNIIAVYERFAISGNTYFSMELIVEARPLDVALHPTLRESPATALALIQQLVSALDHLHANGIAHYELSPQNILVDSSGRLALVDFEHCRKLDPGESDLWPTDRIVGTPLYMSPEHLGKRPCIEADYFVVGTLLMESLIGRHPFFERSSEVPECLRLVGSASAALAQEFLRDSTSPLVPVILQLWDVSPATRRDGWAALRKLTISPAPPTRRSAPLVMKGGGVKGYAYLGALEVLTKFYDFERYIGTSAGAITAVLLAAGYTVEELKLLLAQTELADFLDASKTKAIWNLLVHKGAFPGYKLTDWVDRLLAAKLNSPLRVRLEQLPRRVTIYACRHDRLLVFDSHDPTTQQNLAAFAVRCSVSLPFVFIPERDSGMRVFDGGLRNNYPVDSILSGDEHRFVGLYLGAQVYDKTSKPSSLVRTILDVWTEAVDTENLRKYGARTVIIDPRPVRTADFRLHSDERELLVLAGQVAANRFAQKQHFNGALSDEEIARDEVRLQELRHAIGRRRAIRRRNRLVFGVVPIALGICMCALSLVAGWPIAALKWKSEVERVAERRNLEAVRRHNLMNDLATQDSVKRQNAARGLYPDVAETAAAVFGDSGDAAVAAIGKLRSQGGLLAVDVLVQALATAPLEQARRQATYAVGEMCLSGDRETVRQHVDVLARVMNDPGQNAGMRGEAAHAMAKAGGQKALEALLGVLGSRECPPSLRVTVLRGPGRFWRGEGNGAIRDLNAYEEFLSGAASAIRTYSQADCELIRQEAELQYCEESIRQAIDAVAGERRNGGVTDKNERTGDLPAWLGTPGSSPSPMGPDLLLRALEYAVAIAKEVQGTLDEVRSLAVQVQQAAEAEFDRGHEVITLATNVRRELHDGRLGVERLRLLLNALSTRTGKEKGRRTFATGIRLYVSVCKMVGCGESGRAELVLYLLGQSAGPPTSAVEYLKRWTEVMGLPAATVPEAYLLFIKRAICELLAEHKLAPCAEFMRGEDVFGYATTNILPERGERVTSGERDGLSELTLRQQFNEWYFAGHGKRLEEDDVRRTLRSRGNPLRYDKYVAHWLMQYGVVAFVRADSRSDEDEQVMVRDLYRVLEQYCLTREYLDGTQTWPVYQENLIELMFPKDGSGPIAEARSRAVTERALGDVSTMLAAIRNLASAFKRQVSESRR